MTDSKKSLKKPKAPKPVKSEEQIVREYADKVMDGKRSRGHTDARFAHTQADQKVNKELWLDTDFFFSVVFESAEQKYEFLKKCGWTVDDGTTQVQIVNGVKLAKEMGIELKRETARSYPLANLDLRPYVLDDEKV